ncbi:flavin-containing monooxygenase [Acinetobacter radioresistens]|uniref:flavin-containing monooxygenase n=1 Tax=Acinetobacter radioresistens TaxID=40216 RepID=UPI00094620DF|nr:NAD(P)/FAD-dependent oxidoreductase [Acinetobacter radioresistens]
MNTNEITIIGSGFAGLGLAIKLKQSGINDFKVLERANEVGGTWRDNTYPGVACDIPSHLYSFSFIKNPNWSRVYSPGYEIQQYLIDCSYSENVRDHIDFNTCLEKAFWNNEKKQWTIETNKGTYFTKYLISCSGHLADFCLPKIDGLEIFTGKVLHSAQWDKNIDFKGKKVAVIGSGASAIQLVPELAKEASQLTVFQRSAPYIVPRADRAYTEVEKKLFKKMPETMEELRQKTFWYNESLFSQRRNVKAHVDAIKNYAISHLHNQIKDPSLREKLTPNYEPGCKRLLLSNNYYPTFLKDNVTLEASALDRITPNSVISVDGNEFEVDIIVFATGFEVSRPPSASKIYGKHGKNLEEQWVDGMQGMQSTTVHNFPNYFLLNGPNSGTGHNSAIYYYETQFSLILDALNFLNKEKINVFEASAESENEYMDKIVKLSEGSVWLSAGCKSWYLDPVSRKLTLVWPDYSHAFRDENSTFTKEKYIYSS